MKQLKQRHPDSPEVAEHKSANGRTTAAVWCEGSIEVVQTVGEEGVDMVHMDPGLALAVSLDVLRVHGLTWARASRMFYTGLFAGLVGGAAVALLLIAQHLPT